MRDLIFALSVAGAGLWTLLGIPAALLAHDRGVLALRETLGALADNPQVWSAAAAAYEATFWQQRFLTWAAGMVVLLLIALLTRPGRAGA